MDKSAENHHSQKPDKSKKQPEEAKMVQPGGEEVCFFCGDKPSGECETSIQVCKVVDEGGSDRALKIGGALLGGAGALATSFVTKGKTIVYKKRYVMVPRCFQCKQIHDRISVHTGFFQLFAILCVVILAIYICFTNVVGNAPLWLVIVSLLAVVFF